MDRAAVERCVEAARAFQARLAALFERLPMLCGFHVTENLEIAHLALCTWPGWTARPGVADEIRRALHALIGEAADETAALMRGRTFARHFH